MLRLDRLRALVERLPGRGPGGRDGRRVRLLPARQGRRRAVDRHRDARPGRRRRTWTTCTPTPGSRWPPPSDGEKLTEQCFGDRVVWVPWRRPGFQLGPGHRRDQGGEPAGHRRASSAGTASPPGATPARRPRRTRWRSSAPPSSSWPTTAPPNRSARSCPATRPLPEAERRAKAAAIFPTIRGHRLGRPPAGRALHRQRRGAGVPVPGEARRRWPSWARPARTTSCGPRSSRWSSTCPPPPSVEEIMARLQELHEAYRADYQGYYDRNATPDSPGDAGRGPGDRAGPRGRACSPSARTSRPPGSPASSTSTRST